MYYAMNRDGFRIHIDDALAGDQYCCPICNEVLTMKRGQVIAHHFAHKSVNNCDSFYLGKQKTVWHKKMQNKFPAEMQERAVFDDNRKDFHIADVFVPGTDVGCVFEFQHSAISVEEFISRTQFYLDIGCKVIWIFDFCTCDIPKCLFYHGADYGKRVRRVVWPGRDRVKFLDSDILREFFDANECNVSNDLQVLLFVNTGPGRCIETNAFGAIRNKWEFEDPIRKREYFYIQPLFDEMESIAEFSGAFYTEAEIDRWFKKICSLSKKG